MPCQTYPASPFARPLRLKISGAKVFQLLQANELHIEDLRCLDRRSQGQLKQLLLQCCLASDRIDK